MTIKKLTPEELAQFKKQRAKVSRTPSYEVVVDDKMHKNLQAMIPIDIWVDVRVRAAQEGVPVGRLVEAALDIYLLLEDEDIERIKERIKKQS